MLKLELIIQKNSKKLLMPNGTVFMKNLIRFVNQAQRLCFQVYLSEILLLNISQTETCSVLDVFRKMIFKEQLKLPVQYFRLQFMGSLLRFWVLVVNLKKYNQEMKDGICSQDVKKLNLALWYLEVELLNILKKLNVQ